MKCRKALPLLLLALLLCAAALGEGTALDLTDGSRTSLQAIEEAMAEAGAVTEVDLRGAELSYETRKALVTGHPDVHFRWVMTALGVQVTSEDTDLTITEKRPKKLDSLYQVLDCMPRLKNVYMWNTALDRETRDKLFYGYPDVFFGWRIKMNESHTIRTDATAFSTLGKRPALYLYHTHNFAYCRNLKALDVGHNNLKTLSFLEECPKLKIFIGADCNLTDISPIACQTDLEYLELFLNKQLTDISALANLTNLIDVNLAFCDVRDLSPLYDLPHLERVWLMLNRHLTQADFDALREHQPNCEIVTRSWGATGNVMRKDNSLIPGTSWRDHPRYETIYYIFNHGQYIGWDDEIPIRRKGH